MLRDSSGTRVWRRGRGCFGRLAEGGDGVRVAAWKFAGRSIMSLMNPQTQIKSSKLSAVNECDTRFRNNAKVRCIYSVCIALCSRIGEKRPKTNYRLSRSQYAFEGLHTRTATQKRISLSPVDILFPSRGGKSVCTRPIGRCSAVLR